jgi:hypothetical protein
LEANVKRTRAKPRYIVGLDLGQQRDYTAISVIERLDGGLPEGPELHVRHLERFRDRLYPDVADHVHGLIETPQLVGRVALAVDQTGVGPAVTDLLRRRGIAFTSVHIHGGDSVSRGGGAVRVPKRNLVYTLVAAFQTGRLKISASLDLARVLTDELLNFRLKINPQTGHDSYEHWRENQHDDLVLATALAVWLAEHSKKPYPRTWGSGSRRRGRLSRAR